MHTIDVGLLLRGLWAPRPCMGPRLHVRCVLSSNCWPLRSSQTLVWHPVNFNPTQLQLIDTALTTMCSMLPSQQPQLECVMGATSWTACLGHSKHIRPTLCRD